jgi:hypothetical protein
LSWLSDGTGRPGHYLAPLDLATQDVGDLLVDRRLALMINGHAIKELAAESTLHTQANSP